ncbi:DNA cytosine methyltransferase [Paraburkholderia phymatum]|uniref:DNA cytosine methyltransferase n=1 Tax=Paraburkholderia phymatum TaxID=148447 RepID=A0ACC6U1B3_9BURK
MTAYYNEIDPYAAQWLRNLIAAGHIAAGDIDERSIEDVRPDDLRGYSQCHFFAGIGLWSYALRLAGWDDARPVWTGSCPCQPFSDAGRGLGFADDRHLWPVWCNLIRECRPAIVFGEQVASKAARAWIDLVFADMEGMDYACGAAILPVASVGGPQERDRLWWVADADHARRQGRVGKGESDQAREERPAPRGELVRSMRGPWPPGPGQVNDIPVLVDGSSGRVGRLRAIGNAISPEVAAAFIEASMETLEAA